MLPVLMVVEMAEALHATVTAEEWAQGFLDPAKLRSLLSTFEELGYAAIGAYPHTRWRWLSDPSLPCQCGRHSHPAAARNHRQRDPPRCP